jgi:lysophospholipase L1-like esterase
LDKFQDILPCGANRLYQTRFYFLKMKSKLLVLVACMMAGLSARAQSLDTSVHTVLFLGNSITYAGQYVTDLEAFYRSRHPNHQLEFINVGLPSETVSGLSEPGHAGGAFPRPDLHERLNRVLARIKPDLVFACYGMNDGIYMPFDQQRFGQYQQGITWLRDTLMQTGARVILVTPPVYDQLRGGSKGYAQVLDKYSDWLLAQRKKGWEVADVHYPMKKYLEAHRKVDAAFGIDGFALAPDGVHPGEVGHWLMARQLLLYLGEKEVARYRDIKAAMAAQPNGGEVLRLVGERQALLKDAWLTATGHRRPGMKPGLPLPEAGVKAAHIARQLQALLTPD